MKGLHYSDKNAPDIEMLYQKADIFVSTGDITLFDFGAIRDYTSKKPGFGVYGNHCSGQYLEEVGLVNLHWQVYEYANLRWGGFQGCLKYKKSDLMYTDDQAEHFADNFPQVDILLLHAGAYQMLDDPSDAVHVGSKAIQRYVLEKPPKIIFCGHQYSNAETEIQGIKLYRTFGARIIEI